MSIIRDRVLYSKEEGSLERGEDRYIYRLMDLIQEELRDEGDRDWLVDAVEEKSIRISHIRGRSTKVASALRKLGLHPGDTLHTAYSTNIDFYWAIFGAWLCGGTVSVADPGLSVENIKSQIQDTKAGIVVCNAESSLRYVQANESLPPGQRVSHILVLDREAWEDVAPGAGSFRKLFNDDGSDCPDRGSLPPYNPREPALVNWTSGTTGKPKGVVHSQEYMHLMLRKSKLPAKTVGLATNIFFHGGAILLPLDGGIRNRFQVCFIKVEDFSAPVVFKMIEKYKPMFYMCGASEFTLLSGEEGVVNDLSSLLVIMPTGSTVSTSAVNNMKKKCPNLHFIYQFYGSTEVAGVSSTQDVEKLGALREGVQVYIRHQETGEQLGVGEVGEIMAKTPTVMLEYLNREDETKELLDAEGFVHMGDLGYYDENGILYYKERIKELLKVGNFWIGPGELEDRIQNIEGVVEAVVWQAKDHSTGAYKIMAGVVLQASCSLTTEDIRTSVNTGTVSIKQIDGDIHILDCIPHNPQGKKLRGIVRNKFK